MNHILKRVFLTCLLVLPAAGYAETLDEAWAEALATHQQLAAATARRDAANFDVERARSERSPSLDVVGSFTQLDAAPRFDFGGGMTSGKLFDNDNFATAGAQLSVPLYMGGSISAGIDAAELAATASDQELAAITQNIKLATGELYVQVLRAESALLVSESNVATLEAHTAVAKNRFEFGDVPQNDYLAASVALANARQGQLQAENALDYSRAAYNRFLGRPLTRPVSLDPGLDIDRLIPEGLGVARLTELAELQRHELTSLQSRADALRKQSAAARGRSRPQFALTGGYMFLENEFLDTDQFWMAGLSFQWNLFGGGRDRKHAASLDRQAMAVSYSRNDLATTISLQVRQAWNDRREAEHSAIVADAAVEQAMENLRVVRNRYEAGASTNVVVLDAESLRQQALKNRDDAHHGVALAKLRLARATGLL